MFGVVPSWIENTDTLVLCYCTGRDAVEVRPPAEHYAQQVCHASKNVLEGRQHFKLEGLVIAIVTPFLAGALRIDESSLKAYLQVLTPALVHYQTSAH